MDIRITPGPLAGTVTPPPSKSIAHRAILAQLLAGGGTVSNLAMSQDIEATQRCTAALSAEGTDLPLLDCGESGSGRRVGAGGGYPVRQRSLAPGVGHRWAALSGLRGVRLHPAFSDSPGADAEQRRRLYRPGPADGAAPTALLRHL